MSDAERTYHFVIDSMTPDSLPMARLAAYLADLASLFGYKEHVHFDSVQQGSAILVQRVEQGYDSRVRERLGGAKGAEHLANEVAAAVEALNERLAKDDAAARLQDATGAEILYFPGRDRRAPRTYGPLKQACTFDGVLIRVGGKDDTVPVHLLDGEVVHLCNSTRDMACRLAPYLYQGTLRVWGEGRWERGPDGEWHLIRFDISEFKVLDDVPIDEVVKRLRDVEGSGWREFEDPLVEVQRLRRDADEGG